MKNILEVQMLRYSKIMLGNCCNIRSSLLSSIMSCPQWVIKSPDWPNHSFFKFLTTTKLFSPTLPLHTLLPSPSCPLQSPMVGRILDCVPGPTSIGCSRNFIQLVTGHTPGWINRNGTVSQVSVAGNSPCSSVNYKPLLNTMGMDGWDDWLIPICSTKVCVCLPLGLNLDGDGITAAELGIRSNSDILTLRDLVYLLGCMSALSLCSHEPWSDSPSWRLNIGWALSVPSTNFPSDEPVESVFSSHKTANANKTGLTTKPFVKTLRQHLQSPLLLRLPQLKPNMLWRTSIALAHSALLGLAGFQAWHLRSLPANSRWNMLLIDLSYQPHVESHHP